MSKFGELFTVTTFGESHCYGVGCIVSGVPPRMQLTNADIQKQLDRRRPGQSHITTQRNESDQVVIMSGTEFGYTLGTPIAMLVRNNDQRPQDYGGSSMHDIPRPSHADYTYQEKYGIRASSGGGRASARETIGRVAAGTIAEKWLHETYGISIVAYVSAVSTIVTPELSIPLQNTITRDMIDENIVRCPDDATAKQMIDAITAAKNDHDSLGGVITCIIRNVPSGLGEPTFDKLQATLAHAMLSIPSTKGFEYGSGFDGTKLRGSAHNDMFINEKQIDGTVKLRTATNNSGGIQGGISNGENIVFRIAFKPPATIGVEQKSVDFNGADSVLKAEGRHDPCVLPRAVPIVEAMSALVLADAALIQHARHSAASIYPMMSRINPKSFYADGGAKLVQQLAETNQSQNQQKQ